MLAPGAGPRGAAHITGVSRTAVGSRGAGAPARSGATLWDPLVVNGGQQEEERGRSRFGGCELWRCGVRGSRCRLWGADGGRRPGGSTVRWHRRRSRGWSGRGERHLAARGAPGGQPGARRGRPPCGIGAGGRRRRRLTRETRDDAVVAGLAPGGSPNTERIRPCQEGAGVAGFQRPLSCF